MGTVIASYKKLCVKIMLAFVAAVLSILLSVAPAKAAEYNCGDYGAGTYQNNVCGASTDSSGGGGNGGGLVDTGQSIWLILLAVLLILAGTIMLYCTRKKMKARLVQNS